MASVQLITIGAAVQDVFLEGKVFEPQNEDGQLVDEFVLGSKNEVEKVTYATGGGATNAAVTFARQGQHAFYVGKIGDDVAGKSILDDLHHEEVDTTMVHTSKEFGTGFSCLLVSPNGERTILTYRGASTHYQLTEKDFHGMTADWMYISSLEGNFELLDTVLAYAGHHGIRVAMNPGKKELDQPQRLRELLPKLTILSANKEEMQRVFNGDTIQGLAKEASKIVHYVVVTDGPNGVAACDGVTLVTGGMYEDVPVIDRTGAGDAFSSGFVSKIAAGAGLEEAVIFASANSTSVVTKIGAKSGILHSGAKLHPMPLVSEQLI
jgi:ribokinase